MRPRLYLEWCQPRFRSIALLVPESPQAATKGILKSYVETKPTRAPHLEYSS
jgi:hypothetical protein